MSVPQARCATGSGEQASTPMRSMLVHGNTQEWPRKPARKPKATMSEILSDLKLLAYGCWLWITGQAPPIESKPPKDKGK